MTENQQLAEFIGNPTLIKMQKEGEKINDFIAVYIILNLLCALLLLGGALLACENNICT